MTIQSIRAPIQERNVARNHLFVTPGEMTFREVNFIGKFDNLPQKVGPRAKTLDNARNLLPAGISAPEIIGCGNVSSCVVILDDSYLRPRIHSSEA